VQTVRTAFDIFDQSLASHELAIPLDKRHFFVSLAEFLAVLETCGPLDALYRERAAQLGRRSDRLLFRLLDTVGGMESPVYQVAIRVFDDDWLGKVEAVVGQGQGEEARRLGDELRSLRRKWLEDFTPVFTSYVNDVVALAVHTPRPFEVDLPAWQVDLAEKLISAYRRYLKNTIRFGVKFAAGYVTWRKQAETTGRSMATIRYGDREWYGRGAVPGETPEDRTFDVLITVAELGVLEAAELPKEALAERLLAFLGIRPAGGDAGRTGGATAEEVSHEALPTGSGAEGPDIVPPAAPSTGARAAQGQPEPAAPPAAPVGEQHPEPPKSATPGARAFRGHEPEKPPPDLVAPTDPKTGGTQADVDKTPRPAVTLGKQSDQPKIRGKAVPHLSTTRYNVVKALLNAWPGSLNKDELVTKSGHRDAVNILRRLHDQSRTPEWATAINLAGTRGVGYRIADA
jgi:hypothetical protein